MAAPIQDRLLTDLVAFIQALNLQGTPGVTGDVGDQVYDQLLEEQLNVQFPCVLVNVFGEAEEEGDSTTEYDEVVYPARVVILDPVQGNYQQRRQDYLSWRRQIARALRGLVAYPLLPNCPELADVRIKGGPIFDRGLENAQFVQSGFMARCVTVEPRERNR